uniref:Uncharacterized protein n=1 Tax=Glossina austeni TaxID=7395 RepID=A0A1A9V767_GLOAU
MLLKAAAENRHRDDDDHHHYHHHGGTTTITNVKYTFQAVGYGYELCNQIFFRTTNNFVPSIYDRLQPNFISDTSGLAIGWNRPFQTQSFYTLLFCFQGTNKVSIHMNLASRYRYDVIFPQLIICCNSSDCTFVTVDPRDQSAFYNCIQFLMQNKMI